jgi:uncharacterized damage-inducible protein DinB
MPAMPLPVAGERQSLLEYLKYHHNAFLAACQHLTDEQARSTPTVSTLCIGGLVKHVTTMEYAWTQQVVAEPDRLLRDPRSLAGMVAHRDDQFVMRDDESLSELVDAFNEQNAETLRVFAAADLDATIVVPEYVQAIYEEPHWTVRWVLLHLIEEMARHAGHADIIRESIDGATMFPLLAALEGWSIEQFSRSIGAPS